MSHARPADPRDLGRRTTPIVGLWHALQAELDDLYYRSPSSKHRPYQRRFGVRSTAGEVKRLRMPTDRNLLAPALSTHDAAQILLTQWRNNVPPIATVALSQAPP